MRVAVDGDLALSIASSSAACVFGLARLISSASKTCAKTGLAGTRSR